MLKLPADILEHRPMKILKPLSFALYFSIFGMGIGACSDEPAPITQQNPPPKNLPQGCDDFVEPSGKDDTQAVQSALINAAAGSTVCLGEGTFIFSLSELSITTDGITLKGAGQDLTLMEFKDLQVGANAIVIKSNDVTVTEFTVKNPPGDGIRASQVKNITYQKVSVVWDQAAATSNGAYGLYPVGSQGVRIENCKVQGASDAGIYVGQSSNILVTGSEALGNVAGIEIENSTDAEVVNNHAHDNTAGILVFNLPGLEVQDGKRANVHDNMIENNNLNNFAKMGTTVARVPPGTGVMILASDTNEIHHNTIKNNGSFGVLLFAHLPPLFETGNDPNFNPYGESNWIHDNTFTDNGTNPSADVKLFVPFAPVPDIAWDGCYDSKLDNTNGMYTNCISNNIGNNAMPASYGRLDFCSQFGMNSIDPVPVTCEHSALPAQNP